jgi:hypothetical protein
MKFAAMENSPLESPVAEDSQKQIANTQLVLVPLPIGELSWGWMNTPNYIEAIKPIMHWWQKMLEHCVDFYRASKWASLLTI